jgi:hypothetical protein
MNTAKELIQRGTQLAVRKQELDAEIAAWTAEVNALLVAVANVMSELEESLR